MGFWYKFDVELWIDGYDDDAVFTVHITAKT